MTARIIYLVGFTITGPIFIPLCLSVCLPTRQARIIFLTLAISVCLSLSLSLCPSTIPAPKNQPMSLFFLRTDSFFEIKSIRKIWHDLNSDRQSIRQVRWPLSHDPFLLFFSSQLLQVDRSSLSCPILLPLLQLIHQLRSFSINIGSDFGLRWPEWPFVRIKDVRMVQRSFDRREFGQKVRIKNVPNNENTNIDKKIRLLFLFGMNWGSASPCIITPKLDWAVENTELNYSWPHSLIPSHGTE